MSHLIVVSLFFVFASAAAILYKTTKKVTVSGDHLDVAALYYYVRNKFVVEPLSLRCPVTHTMFRDPVMVTESGFTYERDAIISHFKKNGPTDPMTRARVVPGALQSNRAIRDAVEEWLKGHPKFTPDGWPNSQLPIFDRETAPYLGLHTVANPENVEGLVHADELKHCKALYRCLKRIHILRGGINDENMTDWCKKCELIVDRDMVVKEIHLTAMQLCEIPREIFLFTHLEELYVDHNRLESIPSRIKNLSRLRLINASNNCITEVSAELCTLKNLRVLNLNHNQLKCLPETLHSLRELRELHVVNNNDMAIIDIDIDAFVALRRIFISESTNASSRVDRSILDIT